MDRHSGEGTGQGETGGIRADGTSGPACSGAVAGVMRGGGWIPGAEGEAAFVSGPAGPSALPVLIAVPHAGRVYPPSLLSALRDPLVASARLEDRLVDLLGEAVAAETGAALLLARAPRAMIDLNRAADDVDWTMICDAPAGAFATANSVGVGRREVGGQSGRRARSGLGLVPRRLPGAGELWRRPLALGDLEARIEGVHGPYHARLAAMLAELRERWGAALLVDLHSMPPLGHKGSPGPDMVLGDRFGASCRGALVGATFACLTEHRHVVAHNRPYAGGYVLERHAAPARGIHAIQIEIDRSRYLDSRLAEPGEGFDSVVASLVALVRRLAEVVVDMGGVGGENAGLWREAAE